MHYVTQEKKTNYLVGVKHLPSNHKSLKNFSLLAEFPLVYQNIYLRNICYKYISKAGISEDCNTQHSFSQTSAWFAVWMHQC